MSLKLELKDLEKVILSGDKLLIKPKTQHDKTKSGLYLPPGVHEKEKVHQGYVVKVGPGYPIPSIQDENEAWKQKDKIKYVPLQAKVGDLAVFLQTGVIEIFFNQEKYFIVSNSSVLMLVRDEGLFE